MIWHFITPLLFFIYYHITLHIALNSTKLVFFLWNFFVIYSIIILGDFMGYRYSIKKSKYANRGMSLEDDINISNEYYRTNNIALIYKKPTPIKVSKVDYSNNRIIEAFFEKPSTLDYNGIYKGRYIEFDAKETQSKTSFTLSNIHKHQLEHMKKVSYFNGISFLIVRFNLLNRTFCLFSNDLFNFIENNSRKSIPFNFFENNCYEIDFKYMPRLDYIKIVDIYLKKNNNIEGCDCCEKK